MLSENQSSWSNLVPPDSSRPIINQLHSGPPRASQPEIQRFAGNSISSIFGTSRPRGFGPRARDSSAGGGVRCSRGPNASVYSRSVLRRWLLRTERDADCASGRVRSKTVPQDGFSGNGRRWADRGRDQRREGRLVCPRRGRLGSRRAGGGQLRGVGEPSLFMGWRRGELWLDTELWLATKAPGASVLTGFPVPSFSSEPPRLAASRGRRVAWKQRRHARRARASVIALSPAVTFLLAGLRADGGRAAHRCRGRGSAEPDLPVRGWDPRASGAPGKAGARAPRGRSHTCVLSRRSTGITHGRSGCPTAAGSSTVRSFLSRGRTGSPGTQSRTAFRTSAKRLYGNEHTIRTVLAVTRAYRAAHRHAARVVIGDVSRATAAAQWTTTSPIRTASTSTSTFRASTVT